MVTITLPADPKALSLVSASPEQTRDIGKRLGRLLGDGALLLLNGQLGAGKTVFCQGVAAGLGIASPVQSPSFALINEYALSGREDGLRLLHADLYRLDSLEEIELLGLFEPQPESSVLLVEWAERLGAWRPEEYLEVILELLAPKRRRLCFEASGGAHRELLTQFEGVMEGESCCWQ